MNAYLFTAAITQSQMRPGLTRYGEVETLHTWDSCFNCILLAEDLDGAQKYFEESLHVTPEGEKPISTQVRKIVVAQFIDQLFTESGNLPLDWTQATEKAEALIAATAIDDFEQGYWVEVDRLVRPEELSADIDSLKRELPEDVSSGLNWSPDKKFFFIVSVFSPPQAPANFSESEMLYAQREEGSSDNSTQTETQDPNDGPTSFLEVQEKETAALVQARNSVVAAWLWRKFAANTKLPRNEIRIDPWCGVVRVSL